MSGGDARHVLDGQRIAAHRRELATQLHEFLGRVHRADRVADLAARVLPAFLGSRESRWQVCRVVQRIENPEHIAAGGSRAAHERLDDIIGKARVLDDVLPAQQHECAGFWEPPFSARGADRKKRILVREKPAQAGVDASRRPRSPDAEVSRRKNRALSI
jgi:hypothetical protein